MAERVQRRRCRGEKSLQTSVPAGAALMRAGECSAVGCPVRGQCLAASLVCMHEMPVAAPQDCDNCKWL